MLLGAALFFAVLAGAVTIQAQRLEGQHQLDAVQDRLTGAANEARAMRASVAIAESPERIMTEAQALGMVQPGPVLPLVSVGASPAASGTGGDPAAAVEQPLLPDASSGQVAAASTGGEGTVR